MTLASVNQELQFDPIELEEAIVYAPHQFSGSVPMLGIEAVVQAAAVVKQGEGLDDAAVGGCGFGQPEAIAPHPSPVRRSVYATPVQGKVPTEERDEVAAIH